ncbi:run domain Beclin-1-interacting and cysteine-rich domain-containing protein isoform X2 [Spea bombifrons]|uniref:run domain Beclin-1-interacting and cysteine-rich domain-containing protein isoform X2 n=1 Tax=Spea bombifrons TaxID=233779 RepID=UPI0023495FC9|nr:run domain Beclin-1-interacting and cysteine-rich domain-containing protein isoform X2 [Spea bombifrons]
MEISGLHRTEPVRAEHWKLLDNLKTTVEGLVSGNSRNVWSKYGGLQRLCRDMSDILQHGLVCDQVYCKHQDYWNFVKSSQTLQPVVSPQVEQFLLFYENSRRNGESTGEENGQLWLQHSLQFHCLSAQLKALLGNRQYTRKFYSVSAFLLSEAHVNAMFQCLEAVEQNNPRLLAQIDTSVLAGKQDFTMSGKNVDFTTLSGSPCIPYTDNPRHSLYNPYNSLQVPSSLPAADLLPSLTDQQNNLNKVCTSLPENDSVKLFVPPSCDVSPREPFSPVSEMSVSTLTSHSEEAVSQDDPPSEADDGPEYLAIGNMSRRASSSSNSSSSSNLFPCSTHKAEIPGIPSPVSPSSSLLTVPRRSSFSEGQTSSGSGHPKKSHMRSHSDTNVAMGKNQESHADLALRKNQAIHGKLNSLSSPYSEQDNAQYLNASDCIFRRPSKGQSLISYLSEQDFGSCADLEKENAHFSIAESLIAAIELMKCNMMSRQLQEEEEDSDREIRELKQKIHLRRQQIRTCRALSNSGDGESSDVVVSDSGLQINLHDCTQLSESGSEDEVDQYEIKDGNDGHNQIVMYRNGLSASMASFFSDADINKCSSSRPSESISYSFLHSNSAEAVAMGLLKQFEGMQLPAASELEWLVPEHEAPQKLLPIPDSVPISPDDGEHADIFKLRIRVRGNLEWAPPRPQIIFNIHTASTKKVAVMKQNYRCAGCGIRIEPDYIKRLRYCEYLGKYFCQCCHENAQSVIPGRILRKWDFSKYYVSNFSKDLLTKIWNDPLFNLQDVNSSLYRKVKALEQVRLLRIQLVHLKNMFKTCRLAKGVLESYDTVSGHLTEDLHLFSLNDLSAIKKGDLVQQLRELVRLGTVHVAKCMLCQAKGFICEFCQNEDDVIFPFELTKCRRCEECKACYHKCCFRSDQCPKCERLRARRDLLSKQRLESYNSDQEELEEERDTD